MTSVLIGSILTYKYFIIFPLSLIEGNTVALIAGFFVSMGKLDFTLAYIAILLADLIPDFILYNIGAYGNKNKFLLKYGPKLGLSSNPENSLKYLWSNHGEKILISCKLAYGMAIPLLISAGLVKYPFKKYMTYCTIVSGLKVFIVLIIGYYFGSSYKAADEYIHVFYWVATIAIIIMVVIYIYFTKKISKKIKELEKEGEIS